MAHDAFGRERHATNRSDMSGVGSFSREQVLRTARRSCPRSHSLLLLLPCCDRDPARLCLWGTFFRHYMRVFCIIPAVR